MTDDYKCIVCQSSENYIFDDNSGEIICVNCGVVIAEQRSNEIFTSSSVGHIETGDTGKGDSMSIYALSNELMHNSGGVDGLSGTGNNIITSLMEKMDYSRLGLMSTRIYEGDQDCKGNKIENYFKKLVTVNKMTGEKFDSKKKNLGIAVNTILKINEGIFIPDYIKEDVISEYQSFLDAGNKGISPVFMAAAILYYICQKHKFPISLQKISELLKTHSLEISDKYFKPSTSTSNKDECQKKLFKTYASYIKIMDLSQPMVITYESLIPEMAERLDIKEMYRRSAKKLGASLVEKNRMTFLGKSPKAIAVVLLYFVVQKHNNFLATTTISNLNNHLLTIDRVSKITGISSVTIKKLNKEIDDYMEKYEMDYFRDIVSML